MISVGRSPERRAGAADDERRGALGILAGGGTLPVEIAGHVMRGRRPVHIIALEGEADSIAADVPHTWVNWGQIGRMIATLHKHACSEIVLAGTVRRPNLRSLKPDLGFFLALPRMLRTLRGGDDSVLRRVVSYFESKGFKVVGLADVAPHLLAGPGPLGGWRPALADEAAIARGLSLLEALGPFDVGQAVVATADRIAAIEGAGGTDAMLRGLSGTGRTYAGARVPGGVLVKWPKPGQELRLDLPAVGPRTVAMAGEAGLAGIAVQSGAAVFLDRAKLRASADEAGLFVVGIERQRGSDGRGAGETPITRATAGRGESQRPAGEADAMRLHMRTRRVPNPDERRDISIGRLLLTALAPHGVGASAVVARQYVLAVAANESAIDVLARARDLRQWGRRRPLGVLVMRDTEAAPKWLTEAARRDELVAAIKGACLAGVVVVTPALQVDALSDLVRRLDGERLFLVTVEPAV